MSKLQTFILNNKTARKNLKKYKGTHTKKRVNKNKKLSKQTKKYNKSKSFSPEINKLLVSNRKGNYNNLFTCGMEKFLYDRNSFKEFLSSNANLLVNVGSNKTKKIKCLSWKSKQAKKKALENLKQVKYIDCDLVIAPKQMRSNCWFNVMFMTFFVSDKGRKFFKFFRQLMIEGKQIDGRIVKPESLAKSFFLLNSAIDASLHPFNDYRQNRKKIALYTKTNYLIDYIYDSLPSFAKKQHPSITHSEDANNPLYYYSGIINYLSNNSINIYKIEGVNHLQEIINSSVIIKNIPDIVALSLLTFPNKNNGNKPETFEIKTHEGKAIYSLDSLVIRDTLHEHFACVLTCNKKGYGFDGASYNKLELFHWRELLNKNADWTFEGSYWKGTKNSIFWNFQNGYQLLFYYRIK